MVIGMSLSTALTVPVSTAAVGRFCSSSTASSSGGIYGGHGFRPALPLVMTKTDFDRLPKVVVNSWGRSWRREFSLGGRRKTRNGQVRASSSDETSGEKGPVSTENVPGWAKPNSEELPPWAKNERSASQEPAQEVPFGIYLVGSTLVAIAAVGSIFEYFNKNPVFGVISPDSPFYTPVLGFFAITGLPTAGFLFYKSISLANKASEEADKEDGFRR